MSLDWECVKSGSSVAYLLEQILEDVHIGNETTNAVFMFIARPDEVANVSEARATPFLHRQDSFYEPSNNAIKHNGVMQRRHHP